MASVSFSQQGSAQGDGEESTVQIAIHPSHVSNIQAYQQEGQRPSARSLSFQDTRKKKATCFVLFDRASGSFWNPHFDSGILEEQYQRSTFPQKCQRFQYALLYVFMASVAYLIYFACMARAHWIPFVVSSFIITCYVISALLFTYNDNYQNYCVPASMVTSIILCLSSLLIFIVYTKDNTPDKMDLSPIGMFSICVELLLLLYTVIPLPLYLCVIVGSSYSIVYEILSAILITDDLSIILVRVALQICIHLISIHTMLMAEVRMRNTFMKVGQSLLVGRDLDIEKRLKDKMIHSVMPPKVAKWLMSTQENEEENCEISDIEGERRVSTSPRQSELSFRPFNMHRMEDVSILFADIVGFTKMSSNKSAEQLVGLLNDLFGRFDYLCVKLGCEKISTLGDCYYCVSGCPEPRPDHAKCCAEMGLGMIKAIGEFDEDTNEDVNMRVGIHTGTVLCGIVGTCRFKFDVWSNDVSYANLMESTGKPGKVHISESTYTFLQDLYHVEDGQPHKGVTPLGSGVFSTDDVRTFPGVNTYFIKNRKPGAVFMYDRIATLHSGTTRHSWPSQLIERRGSNQRKPSCQSEKSANVNDDEPTAAMPMLQFAASQGQGSHSTISSSRKDSGIRSRHSSLQDMMLDTTSIMAAHLFSHRVSGYETSSQTSVADTGRSSGSSIRGASIFVDPNVSLHVSLARLRHLRKQSDLQMIRCVQSDSAHLDYFVRPPVNRFSLFFIENKMESAYRKRFHNKNPKDAVLTLASATLNTYCDIFFASLFFLVFAISCFCLFRVTLPWTLTFALGLAWLIFIIVLCLCEIFFTQGHCRSPCVSRLYKFYTQWYPWHFCGAILVSLPAVCVYANLLCCQQVLSNSKAHAFFFLVLVSVVHFCNFAQLNFWLKSLLAALSGTGMILVLLTTSHFCPPKPLLPLNLNATLFQEKNPYYYCYPSLIYEIVLDVTLLIALVWFLNREFEISYRLSFHGSIRAARDKRKIQRMKNQADWLLHNIIPKHVADQLKSTAKYSQNHENAGILFASIVNFSEMYDESYEGGKEFLRVLNELVGDFDELLLKPSFRNVEKIKTIGSTFMAASGLNPKLRMENPSPNTHLIELLDFAIAMQHVIERFNCNLLGFNFIIRIGYNFGDITAGVIGTTKLYYDIWGDAVNTASRMDSTGVPGRIQLPEHCIPVLKDHFEFENRGTFFVKGKDNMNVYLVVKKKENLDSNGEEM